MRRASLSFLSVILQFRMRLSHFAAFAVLMLAVPAVAQEPPSADVLAAYRSKLARYEKVHRAYEKRADVYWDEISAKRRLRIDKRRRHEPPALSDYVLAQPPVYTGPPRPVDPARPVEPAPEKPPIPVVADFLKAAEKEFGFVPDLPRSDRDFKRAYAKAASAAGLSKEQIVGVYAFETGGNGAYDTQAGVTPTRSRAISPALGYNQLLSTNTVSLLAEHGERYVAVLRAKALMMRGEDRRQFERKIGAFKRMIAYCRTVPPRWSAYDQLAKTTVGGWGVHAAVLDVDIGPMLQVQKLVDSVRFARMKGYDAPLSAAELELMNLTGDGNGIDMVTMSPALREQVPTANFFQPEGYWRNPIARRSGTVAKLIAEIADTMQREERSDGAKDLASAF
jgi:hypothetical protein